MSHLGADVAAYVDGQLSGRAMAAARQHLHDCERCRTAVFQQEALKSRMSSAPAPELSPEFLACLSRLPRASITRESVWSRVRRSRSVRLGTAFLGGALTVLLVAYSLGGVRETVGDKVTPVADKYTADFTSPTVAHQTKAASGPSDVTPETMSQLEASGWPCHAILAGDLHRVKATWLEHGQVISLTYASATRRLDLIEQNGVLDPRGLHGFDRRSVNGSKVWVRDGIPTVVAWDNDGIVYTLVTDADKTEIDSVLRELPTPAPDENPARRIGDGFDRMATWITPAA